MPNKVKQLEETLLEKEKLLKQKEEQLKESNEQIEALKNVLEEERCRNNELKLKVITPCDV